MNAPQQPFPDGLLGRSETTVAASNSGKLLLAGFNDAQGFCGPPFGAPCTPENPPGLSGFAFSTDGGLTWTDGGAPDPALSPGGNVFTRGDPWMDRGAPTAKPFTTPIWPLITSLAPVQSVTGGKTFRHSGEGYNRHQQLVHNRDQHLPQFWRLYRRCIRSESRFSDLGRWASWYT